MISFNETFTDANPTLFPTELVPVITAFWTTPSVEQVAASWEYVIISDSDNDAGTIVHIKEYLKSKNIELNVTLVVIAKWQNTISSISEVFFIEF